MLRWREKVGWSQKEAGARVGVSQTSWKDWESEARTPSFERAVRIEVLTEREITIESFGYDAAPAFELVRLRTERKSEPTTEAAQ